MSQICSSMDINSNTSSSSKVNLNINHSARANQRSTARSSALPAGREKRALNDNQLPPAKKLQSDRIHPAHPAGFERQRASDASAEIFPDDDDDILLLAADIAIEDATPEQHSDTPPLAGSMAHQMMQKNSGFNATAAASAPNSSASSAVRNVSVAADLPRPFTYLAAHLRRRCSTDPAATICIKVTIETPRLRNLALSETRIQNPRRSSKAENKKRKKERKK